MTPAQRFRRAMLVLLLAAVVAVFVWPTSRAPDSAPVAPRASVPATTEPKPRAERRRDVAEPAGPDAGPTADGAASAQGAPKPGDARPIAVTVLRADGTPAAEAHVVLYDEDESTGDFSHVRDRARTDERGEAKLVPATSSVRVAAWLGVEATATAELFDPKAAREVVLRLTPAMTVRGRVLGGEVAVAGADVELMVEPWFQRSFGLRLRTTTDASGAYAFPPFAIAGVDPLNPPFVEATTKDMARGFAEADLERPGPDVDVWLVPGFTARARFVDAHGAPVGVELTASGYPARTATSDAEGRVALRLPQGRYRFVALRATKLTYIQDFDVEVASTAFIADPIVGHWRVARDAGVHEDGAGDVDLGDVVMAAGKPVEGVVVDSAGAPMRRGTVALFLGDVRVSSGVTDENGRFEFPEVGDDAHRVEACEMRVSNRSRRATADGVRGGCAPLRLALSDAHVVEFHFLSADTRKPVEATGVTVKAFRHGETSTVAGHESVGGLAASDAVEVPAAGSYDFDVKVAGHEAQRLEAVEVVAGRATSIELLLRRKRE